VTRRFLVVAAALLAGGMGVTAQVTSTRLVEAAKEPQNWLTYSGAYSGQRYSPLTQITPANVKHLEIKWLLQNQVFGSWESSPLVIDGVMYLTQRPNDVLAVDAKTGRLFWIYRYVGASDVKICCGANNRGLGVHGHTLFMGTLDATLVAIDARSGRQVWKTKVAEHSHGYSISLAPLVVKDTVIIGVGGGEYGIRGFIAAYDVATGAERWRFTTVPAPGEPGAETWSGDSWKTGGGSLWVTGTYDPALNLTYWGVGNPGPDFNPSQRQGDNLYTDSVVALDADTGALKWHFQFTPNDAYDWDAIQVPVLVDAPWQGRPSKLLMAANRNGFFYVLDRETGKFLLGRPFVKVNWASGLDVNGRPIPTPQPPGMPTFPGQQGGTNWWSPAYSPRTGLFYVGAWENVSGVFTPAPVEYKPGGNFMGGSFRATRPVPDAPASPNIGRPPINTWTDAQAHGVILALDPATGTRRWTFPLYDLTESGIMTTASDLLFTGNRDGYLLALDARSGALLWKSNLSSAQMRSAPTTYMVDGQQFITYISGNVLIAFGLRE